MILKTVSIIYLATITYQLIRVSIYQYFHKKYIDSEYQGFFHAVKKQYYEFGGGTHIAMNEKVVDALIYVLFFIAAPIITISSFVEDLRLYKALILAQIKTNGFLLKEKIKSHYKLFRLKMYARYNIPYGQLKRCLKLVELQSPYSNLPASLKAKAMSSVYFLLVSNVPPVLQPIYIKSEVTAMEDALAVAGLVINTKVYDDLVSDFEAQARKKPKPPYKVDINYQEYQVKLFHLLDESDMFSEAAKEYLRDKYLRQQNDSNTWRSFMDYVVHVLVGSAYKSQPQFSWMDEMNQFDFINKEANN